MKEPKENRSSVPQPPIGREEAVRARERAKESGQTLYDDFDTYYRPARKQREHAPRPPRRRALWLLVTLVCLALVCALGLLVAPQVLGIRFTRLPNFAFADGSILTYDEETYAEFARARDALNVSTIYPGVFIDGVDVGGMTVEEARAALENREDEESGIFGINVTIGSQGWLIDSDAVPMHRNLEEMLQLAYAQGRTNTPRTRRGGDAPMWERLSAVEQLRNQPVYLSTSLTYNRDALRQATDDIAAMVNVAPMDAQLAGFDFATQTFSFTDDVPGTYLSADELYSRVAGALDAGDFFASVVMEPETILADLTKLELAASFGQISTYTTTTTKNANRNTNIELSANAISGQVVAPGEVFSFNQATGQRTAAKGYKEATAISGGQNVPEVGGGVCQTSSTLFNAVARANLEIVSRSPHAWPSSYVKEGMDATVNWPGLDFKFRNNTEYPVYIIASYAKNKVTVSLYGKTLGKGVSIDLDSQCIRTLKAPSGVKEVQNTSLPRGTRQTTVKARNGSVWETYQVWYEGGQETRRELLFTSTYKAYQQTVEYN